MNAATVSSSPWLRDILAKYPLSRGSLIPILQEIQETQGYLSEEAFGELEAEMGISANEIYGVATFYSQFRFTPPGKHHVTVCKGTACHVRGSNKVIEAVEGALGIGEGETTEDRAFSFETVSCLGACALAPLAVIDKTYYGKMTVRRAEKIMGELAAEEE